MAQETKMPKQRRNFIPINVHAQHQRLKAEKAREAEELEKTNQLAVQKAVEKILLLKQLLDQHDDQDDSAFHDMIAMEAFTDMYIRLSVATSGNPPINTQSQLPTSCITLDHFMTLLSSKHLSVDGTDFQGSIRLVVENQQVTIEKLQQLVVVHYEQNNIDCIQHCSDMMLLKVDLVFIADEVSVRRYVPFCQVALNCYYDLKGWRVFTWDQFLGENWIILKSSLETTLKRSDDGRYHITSPADVSLVSS